MTIKEKVLIVNNNMQMGGIQKALLNLLQEMHDHCEITLLLFSSYGDLLSKVPSNVNVIFASKPFQVLGTPWDKLKHNPFLVMCKLITLAIHKLFGKRVAFKFLSIFQKKIRGYTYAVSFSHCTNEKKFSICTPEFVLNCVDSKKKICYIHCDYAHSDTASIYNNAIYRQFDLIACCSGSVMNRFLSVVPDLKDKTVVARNFYDLSVLNQAKMEPYIYDQKFINIISVARLSQEKGIFRAIESIHNSERSDIRYFIIGDGPERSDIERYITDHSLEKQVVLLGELINPYRFMINADYLLVPSYHEAAPMVFDEANMLNLNIISTNTTSAKEMLSPTVDIILEDFDKQIWVNLQKSYGKKQFLAQNNTAMNMFLDMLKG